MAYSLPLQAYICQKGIRNVFPSSTSRLLPGIESALPPIQSINSSPSSVLLTPLEAGQMVSFPAMHPILGDNQNVYGAAYPTMPHYPRSQVRNDVMASSSLPLPAVEYFVHVAWDVINGKTELGSQSALHLVIHPPTPPPQAPVLQPEPAFRDYIHRLIATTAVSQSVVVIALFYLYRARSALQRQLVIGDVIDRRQGYSMCAASLMLGNKYLDDNTYTSRTWATLSGYSLWEINDCEKRLLQALNFQLNISLQEYNDWLRLLALYTPFPAFREIKSNMAPFQPLIAESRAPLMPLTQRRISRIETSRPASRKRSLAEPEVANVNKRVMLSTHQQPFATSHVVAYQNHPCMYTQPQPYSVPPPQLYPFAIENSFAIQEYPLGYYKLAASPADPRVNDHYRKFQLVEPQAQQPLPQTVPATQMCNSSAFYPSFIDPWRSAPFAPSSLAHSVQPQHVSTPSRSNGDEQYTPYGESQSLQSRKAFFTSATQVDEHTFAPHQVSIYAQTTIDYGHFD